MTSTQAPNLTKKKESLFYSSQQHDNVFLAMVLVVLLVGLVMMFSASYVTAYFSEGDSYHYIVRQGCFAVIGVIAMLVISRINYKKLFTKKIVFAYYIICVLALILVLFIGVGDNGETRWINLGFTTVQPSEFAKLAVILILAFYLSKNSTHLKNPLIGVFIPLIIIGLAGGLVLFEPHLSGAILIIFVGYVMLLVAGCNYGWLIGLGALGAACIGFICMSVDYMRSRIEIWRDPASDALGKGYQTLQSLYAIGSGGLTGLGLGQSRQKYLYLPEPQNDYVFSVCGEELGFIGCLIIMVLFIILIGRGFRIAMRADSKFGSYLVFGITFRLALQVILNIAVVTNAIPCTGISLPFFSYGGTALFVQLVEMGIVLSVSRQANMTKN